MKTNQTEATIYTNLDQLALVLTASYDMAKRYENWAGASDEDEATEWINKATSIRAFCLQLEGIQLELAKTNRKESKK